MIAVIVLDIILSELVQNTITIEKEEKLHGKTYLRNGLKEKLRKQTLRNQVLEKSIVLYMTPEISYPSGFS